MQGKNEYVIVADYYWWKLLVCFVLLGIPSLSILLITQSKELLLPAYLPTPYFMASHCLSPRPSEIALYFHSFLRSGLGSSYSVPQKIQFIHQTLLQAHKSCCLGVNSPNTSQSSMTEQESGGSLQTDFVGATLTCGFINLHLLHLLKGWQHLTQIMCYLNDITT